LSTTAEFAPGLSRPLDLQSEQSVEAVEVSEGESDEQAEMQRLEPFTAILLRNVEVRPVRDTRLIEIHYRHRLPDLARKIADNWAEAYKDNNFNDIYNTNQDSGRFLAKTINDYKIKVQQSEERLLNFRRANEVIDFGERENTVIARLGSLNQTLLQAENERKNAQLTYELSRNVPDVTTLPEIQRDPMVQDLNKRMTDLRATREQLLVEFTPEWPEVRKVTQQIVTARRRAACRPPANPEHDREPSTGPRCSAKIRCERPSTSSGSRRSSRVRGRFRPRCCSRRSTQTGRCSTGCCRASRGGALDRGSLQEQHPGDRELGPPKESGGAEAGDRTSF
jgi:hypothetical protein